LTVVFLKDKDDRNIKKRLIFFNFKNYLFGIYILRGFVPIGMMTSEKQKKVSRGKNDGF